MSILFQIKKGQQVKQLVEELDADFENEDKDDGAQGQSSASDKKPTSVGLKDAFKKTEGKSDDAENNENDETADKDDADK